GQPSPRLPLRAVDCDDDEGGEIPAEHVEAPFIQKPPWGLDRNILPAFTVLSASNFDYRSRNNRAPLGSRRHFSGNTALEFCRW
ncbi:MAG: hypothetical protein AAGA19_14665, partial [Pseudomonadota bacterium]